MAPDPNTDSGPRTFYERSLAMNATNDEQEAANTQKASIGQNAAGAAVNREPATRVEKPRQLRATVNAFSPTVKKSEFNDPSNNRGLQSLHDRPAVKRTAISISSSALSHSSLGTNTGGIAASSSGQVRSTEDQIERLRATNLASTSSSNIIGTNKRAASSQLDPTMDSTAYTKSSSGTNSPMSKSTLQFAPHLKSTRAITGPHASVGFGTTASLHTTANSQVNTHREVAACPKISASSQVNVSSRVTADPSAISPEVIRDEVNDPHTTGTVVSQVVAPHHVKSLETVAPHRKVVKLNHDPDSAEPTISRSTVLKSFGITSDPVTNQVKAEAPGEQSNGHIKVEGAADDDHIQTDESPADLATAAFPFATLVGHSSNDGKVSAPAVLPTIASPSVDGGPTRASANEPASNGTTSKEHVLDGTLNDTSNSGLTEYNIVNGTTSKRTSLDGASNGVSGNDITIEGAHSNAKGPDKALPKPADLVTVFDTFGLHEVASENIVQKLFQELDELRGHHRLANVLLASYAERFRAMEQRIQELERSTGTGKLKSRVLLVIVEFPNGQVIQLEASPHMKLSELLQAVRSETGREFVYCKFVHSNMVLAPEKRLGDYEIKSGDTLFLKDQSNDSNSTQCIRR